MSKTITLRLSDNEYGQIAATAHVEHRPISNYITTVVLQQIESSLHTDSVESSQILTDNKLLRKLSRGHSDAKRRRGKFVV